MDKDRDGKVTEGEANNYLKRIGFGGFDKYIFLLFWQEQGRIRLLVGNQQCV
jgi:hypothetical protein